jgi:hypothetical protein
MDNGRHRSAVSALKIQTRRIDQIKPPGQSCCQAIATVAVLCMQATLDDFTDCTSESSTCQHACKISDFKVQHADQLLATICGMCTN